VEAIRKIKNLEHLKLAIVFVALNITDALLTNAIMSAGGRELNPAMRYFFTQPKWVSWGFEIGGTIVATFGLLLLATFSPRLIKVVFITLIAIMAFVCLYNGIGLFS